ncbi:MAG: hypothetical protein NTX28_01340 [Novosphingobium sp.]|nr:hypothetical protein [Novosphingobium sp.]
MSNMTRIDLRSRRLGEPVLRPALGMALVLAVAACQQAPSPTEPAASATAEPASVASVAASGAADATAASASLPATIDDPAVATDRPVIVARRDEPYQGKPICVIEVRYPGAVDQPVYWSDEACADVTAAFVDEKRLAGLLGARTLSEETRDDIARTGGTVLYVEGGASSSLYPLNSAGRVYPVPLAD